MTDLKIGVVGIPGKWSTEVLADALEARTGFRCVVDMADAVLDRCGDLGSIEAVVNLQLYTPAGSACHDGQAGYVE